MFTASSWSADINPSDSSVTGERPRASERVWLMASRTFLAISPARARRVAGARRQFLLQHLAHHFNPGQVLAKAVVQIVPDAALLAFADFQDFPFQPFAFGDVADEAP